MSNTAGKTLKKLHHEDNLRFNKLVLIAKKREMVNPVLKAVMAMSFKHGTSHFYGEESDEDLQQSEALLDKKPPAVVVTVTPKKQQEEEKKNKDEDIDNHKILGKKPAAIETERLLTQEEREEDGKTQEKFSDTFLLGKALACKYCGMQPCFVKTKWGVLKFILDEINTLYPYQTANVKRKIVYQHFAGHLTYLQRTRHLLCIRMRIHKEIPRAAGDPPYMGHKDK